MLVTLGARNQVDDLVDLLAACHRRIRQHLVFARRLVAATEPSPREVSETASQIRRYFAEALPLHVADEDLSIAPHLAQADAEVRAAVKRMAVDHCDHQYLVDGLVELCSAIEREPAELAASGVRLSRLVEVLATELAAHLELEERVVFPAIRGLAPELRAEIRDEMRRRRA